MTPPTTPDQPPPRTAGDRAAGALDPWALLIRVAETQMGVAALDAVNPHPRSAEEQDEREYVEEQADDAIGAVLAWYTNPARLTAGATRTPAAPASEAVACGDEAERERETLRQLTAPRTDSEDARALLAAVQHGTGIEYDRVARKWWLPGDPAPRSFDTLGDALIAFGSSAPARPAPAPDDAADVVVDGRRYVRTALGWCEVEGDGMRYLVNDRIAGFLTALAAARAREGADAVASVEHCLHIAKIEAACAPHDEAPFWKGYRGAANRIAAGIREHVLAALHPARDGEGRGEG